METEDIIRDLVEFQTVQGNTEEFEKAFSYIEDFFSEDDFRIEEFEYDGVKSVLIGFEDLKEPELMLHGHIDVVEAEDEKFEPRTENSRMYGRGTADMKAGVACFMKLLEELKDEQPSVSLLITSDEEVGGLNGTKKVVEEDVDPEFAITGEPDNIPDGYLDIITKQKGVIHARLEAEGRSAHAARLWKGDNAAEKIIETYREDVRPLFAENEEDWATTCNLGLIEGGKTLNKVPREAEIGLDIRWTKGYPSEEVIEDLEALDAELEVLIEAPMLNTDNENKYVQRLGEAVEEVTGSSRTVKKEPASDARHFSREGIPAVVFGPEGYNIHEPNEYVNLESLEDYIEVLKKFVAGLEQLKKI